jgi:putative sterol carrier protein
MKRFAMLKPLVERRRDDAGDALRSLARQLAGTPERGRVQLRLVGRSESESQTWDVELAPKGAKAAKAAGSGKAARRAGGQPDLEIVTRAQTWDRIADGTLSPLEAFLSGELRLRGDSELAKRIVSHLAADDGEVDICR